MPRRILFVAALTWVGSSVASAQGLDGLFFEMTMRSGRIEANHYFFLPAGRYLNGVPDSGLAPANMEPACAKPIKAYSGSSRCGTYAPSGGNLVLTPQQGRQESLTFERSTEGNLTLGGHFAKHVPAFPAGTKLDGKYSRVNSAGPASYGESWTFHPDGTFSTSSLAGVSTEKGSGKKEAAAAGTYRLSGNVLELLSNGNTTRIVAYPYDLGQGDVRLSLDGTFYKK